MKKLLTLLLLTGAVTAALFAADVRDNSSNHPAHVSHFGVLKSGPTVPVLKGNFPGSALDQKQWEQVAINSATLSVADGMAQVQSGTNSAGSIKLFSRRQGRFEAGQVSVFQSGVRAGAGVADNTRIWGLLTKDEQDGLYFKWSGTTFQVVARKGGTETSVNSRSFTGGNFEPADRNTTYRIEYSAGRATFYAAQRGRKLLLHEMVDTASPLVDDLDLGLYYENTNSGNTSNVSMYVRGASSSVWGSLDRYNAGGAHLTADFDTEVALDTVSRYDITTKFGRNPDVDSTTDPEDVWNGGSTYTGFNATADENIEIFSADANDTGTLVSSGTATGGSRTTIVDSAATFQTDSVAVGDLLINDTKATHGVIASVDSETQVTVHRMHGDHPNTVKLNVSGDSYRIANASGTGAAVVRMNQLLDEDFTQQDAAYAILNGTTGVTVTGDFARCPRASVILAGSGGTNAGAITIRQATTTANVFAVMPAGYGQTQIGAFTVSAGKLLVVRRVRCSIVRANGSAGSATILLMARRRGEVFRAIRSFEIQTGAPTEFTAVGGDVLPPMTDVKFRVDQVSDSNTIIDAAIEYTLFTED